MPAELVMPLSPAEAEELTAAEDAIDRCRRSFVAAGLLPGGV